LPRSDDGSDSSEASRSREAAPGVEQSRRLWHSSGVERALLCADIETSIAHVRTLEQCNVVPREVARQVEEALQQIAAELSNGQPVLSSGDTSISGGVERRVHELAGSNADILMLGRSLEERVATNMRVWLRSACIVVGQRINSLRQVLVKLSERDNEVVMPGYTHMHPSSPMLLADWWLANEVRMRRDFARLIDVFKHIGTLPTGAANQSTESAMMIDRTLTARFLGFEQVAENRLDAVCDRDYVLEFASSASSIGVHISQMASELLLWSTHEHGFVRLPRGFVFRGQTMPMKRNVELLEIMRSRPSAITGRLVEFLSQQKGLPLCFTQDLQESLPGILEIVDNLKFILELSSALLPILRFDTSRLRDLANSDLHNADNAIDFLLERGLPPEKAAQTAQGLLSYCKDRNRQLYDLTLNEWVQFSPAFTEEIFQFIESSPREQSYFAHGAEALRAEQAVEIANNSLNSDMQTVTNLQSKRLNCRELEGV
jgi:argininosuccinate lyase